MGYNTHLVQYYTLPEAWAKWGDKGPTNLVHHGTNYDGQYSGELNLW